MININPKRLFKSIPQSYVTGKVTKEEINKFPMWSFVKGLKIHTPIRPFDNQWMIEEGYHKPFVSIDKSLFVKTKLERETVKYKRNLWNKENKNYKPQLIVV